MEDNNLTKEQLRKMKAKERMRRKRENPEHKREETERNKRYMKTRRLENDIRNKEQQCNSEAHRLARLEEERRHSEQQRNSEAHRLARHEEERRISEQKRNSEAHRLARLDEEHRISEQKRNSEAHRLARLDEEHRVSEQQINTLQRQVNRMNILEQITFDDICQFYENNIIKGPTIICKSCSGLFFETSIRVTSYNTLVRNGINQNFLAQICDTVDKLNFCINCHRDIKKCKFPTLSKVNGLCFPMIPIELQNLTEVEIRLISPRIPFMQIRELSKRDKQFAIKGNVVNVPISVDTSVNSLPRTFDNTFTIQLKLKRKLCYQSHYLYETIRPSVCYDAVCYLVNTPLYKLENITLSQNWKSLHSNEKENFIVLEEDKPISTQNEVLDEPMETDEEQWTEIEEEDNVTTNDTLWSDNDISQAISFAPGEGKYPLSILRDEFAEELSFPNIYCGMPRKVNKNVSYANICKWELRHFDRRCCYVAKLFFMLKKRQLQMITNQISIHLRKRKTTKNVTAGQLLDKEFVDTLCKSDDGYRFLKVDRASPAYWQSRKREVLAMIRQIGIPTLFVTFSAAETRWKELLVILMKTVRNKDITQEETSNLNYKDKCELISKDPVTCSRYFDMRIRELFKVLKHSKGPFSDNIIIDQYIRVEFQHRGSPHVHCLLWLANAPQYDKDNSASITDCISFIDKYITTSLTDENLINLQTHGHSKSCIKFCGDKINCRFDFPQMPMPQTMILEPLELCDTFEQYEELYSDIRQKLTELEKQSKSGHINLEDISFEALLSEFKITFEDYINAIRSAIKHPKVFLKRDFNCMRINGYNTKILKLHRANMDIQFVIDPYSCVQYILNYLNKPDRGMSKLLKEAVEEVKAGNFSIRDRLKIIGDRYLKATEISAQEAVYHLLSMDLSRCSRGHVFINTGENTSREKFIKSETMLKELDSTSQDIYQKGDLDYYVLRPDSLSSLCLADFCAEYNRYNKRPNKKSKCKLIKTENDDDQINEEDEEIGQVIALKSNAGYLEKRKRPKIIRFRRYNIKTDEHNYFREQCQLFCPWSNEIEDLINVDIEIKFKNNIDIIKTNSAKYFYFRQDVADFEDRFREIEHHFIENEEKEEKQSHEYSVYSIDTQANYSLSQDISGDTPKLKMEKFMAPKFKSEDDYRKLMQSLNEKQRKYSMNILHCMKSNDKPIYHTIIGGAGVGKSCLISAIYQTLLRYYNSLPGSRPETLKVLLCAPTGKAAFNIGGVTTNSAFDIFNQNHTYSNLSHDRRNSLLSNFIDLKLIIIDEISMVGISQFEFIDLRLQEIFGTNKIFGGISVICFGDFFQLRPVQDYFVFKVNTKNRYGLLFENNLWKNFQAYELTEIMRQKDDKKFALALNNLASGNCTIEDIQLFKSREISINHNQPPSNAINLFRTNADVDNYNMSVLNMNNSKAFENRADDIAEGDVSADVKQKALNIITMKKRTETYGLPTNILLKEKGNYMITVNIDTEDGLVNGASGILKIIEVVANIPYKLWIEFSDLNVGMKARQRSQLAIKRCGYNSNWTPIEKLTRDIPMNNPKFKQNVRIKRTQFPVVSCEALTINKAQGQSYDNVVVNISPKDKKLMLSHVYVGLSRARTACGLYINDEFFQPRKTNAVLEVESERNRLRTEAALKFALKFLVEDISDSVKVLFHNVQSLQNNYDDILHDNNYMAADLLLFVETWVMHEEEFTIPSFNIVAQITSKKEIKAYGCAIYSKVDCNELFVYKHQDKKSYFHCIAINIKDTNILLIYNSVLTSKSELFIHMKDCLQKVKSENAIILGDFNLNIMCDTNQDFLSFMRDNGFTLMNTGVTTNGNTQLDMVFARNNSPNINLYESYFSYHKPLWFII